MSNKIEVSSDEALAEPVWITGVEPFIQKVFNRLDIDQWELSVLFCHDPFIADLNKRFRDIEGPTDVLSFEQGDEYIDDDEVTWFNAGDIVISVDALARNCEEFNVSMNDELKRLLVHGILHLDGMDHADNSPEQEMLQFQEHLLSGFSSISLVGES
ncbi:rRNA maturation RNase YbeY [Treponema zuelzerae]|uniref:Endoribonuclease YbeY n=1 Tax=Teretinema zuelzerae TaxID=156 RepID=A0AAE3EHF8_9SPIR|nr:rRNA maturation RNase YbeY [Teretinema zuelzerae]MBN2811065.1 rRNA maturation RNase YbeY [Spirochaetales bacterium]MCD1654707.1 rRNA maturation RNase YbeY [Teretinema zuelzerae]HPO01755.1 rRNA maturation RNase YbeY [Treponemataceae bacterium]